MPVMYSIPCMYDADSVIASRLFWHTGPGLFEGLALTRALRREALHPEPRVVAVLGGAQHRQELHVFAVLRAQAGGAEGRQVLLRDMQGLEALAPQGEKL